MRVLHVVRQFSPGIGGLENFVANLVREQTHAGHAVTVLTLDRIFTERDRLLPASDRFGACKIVRVPYLGSHRYPLARYFLRHLRDADIVHVHGIDFFFDALAATRRLHRKPLVVSTHGGFFHTRYALWLKRHYFRTVTKVSLGAYSAVLASSVNDRDIFATIAKRPVELIENGVDIAKFGDCASLEFRKSMIAIGRFASHKRFDRLFDFLRAVRDKDPEWTLTVVGAEWDLRADHIRRLADTRGQRDAVRVIAGASDACIRAQIEDASVIVSASDYEGFGIAVIEGMSAGLWPVLNDIPAFRRVQEESRLGLAGAFSEPAVLAQQFLEAMPVLERDHAALRKQSITFSKTYAWPLVARKIEAVYDRIVGERRRTIAGVPVLVTSTERAIAKLDAKAAAGRTTPVAFLNAHTANVARIDARFRRALQRFVVLNDGIGVDIASRWFYRRRFPENLNGTDFVIEYLKRTKLRHALYLLGSRPDIVSRTAARLDAMFPNHRVAGWHHGFFDPSHNGRIADDIRASGADILLVGMGNPMQELWIMENGARTGCRLAFGVGALFDFVSGARMRAPAFVRALRAEWVWRLALEPRRLWRRYVLGNAAFLAYVLRRRQGSDA